MYSNPNALEYYSTNYPSHSLDHAEPFPQSLTSSFQSSQPLSHGISTPGRIRLQQSHVPNNYSYNQPSNQGNGSFSASYTNHPQSTHITQLPPQPSSFYDPVDRRINRQPTTPPSTHNHPLTNKYDDESLINRLKSLLIDQTSPPQKKRAPYQTPSVTEYPTHSQPSPVLVQSISANYSQPTTYTDVADDIHSIDQDQNSESEDYAGDRVHLRTGHRKKHILGTIVREPIRKKRISRKKVTSHQTESESEEEEALSNADLSQSSPTPLIRHCPPEPAPTRQSRPQSQHSSSSIIRPKTATIRKANPMEKYHQYNSEWERNPYLKHNKHHRKTIIIGKRPEQAHEPFRPPELVEPHSKSIPQPSEYVVPTKKRRDRLVWQVRSQMADEDY